MTCLLSCIFLNSSLLLPLTLAPSFSLALTLPSSWPPSPFFTLSPFRPLYSSLSPSLPLPLSFKVACCPWAPLSWRSTARGTAEGDTSLLSSPCKVTATPHSLLNECLSVYMSVCLSVSLSVCLSVCQCYLLCLLVKTDWSWQPPFSPLPSHHFTSLSHPLRPFLHLNTISGRVASGLCRVCDC